MNKDELARETRKQRRLEILGTNDPLCCLCGQRDWRCLELHHPSDHGRDGTLVTVCRNCHRTMSDDQKSHPPFDPNAEPMPDAIGHFLLGLADMLRTIGPKLYDFGLALIEHAKPVIDGDDQSLP